MINCFMVPTGQNSCLSSPWYPTLILGVALFIASVLGILPCHLLSFSVADKHCVKQWTILTHAGCCHNARQHKRQSQAGHKWVCQGLASTLVMYAWNLTVLQSFMNYALEQMDVVFVTMTDWPITIFHDRRSLVPSQWPYGLLEQFSQTTENH